MITKCVQNLKEGFGSMNIVGYFLSSSNERGRQNAKSTPGYTTEWHATRLQQLLCLKEPNT